MNDKFTAVIIDDLEENISLLKDLLDAYCPTIKVIGEACTIKKAIELIDDKKPEIIFLDVELNEGTCFDILNKITYKESKIISTTSHDKYAINAFEYNISGYLLKPIKTEKLIKTTLNVCEEALKRRAFLKQNTAETEFLTVSSLNKLDVIKLSEVNYIQSKGQYSLFLLDNREVIGTKNIGFYYDKITKVNFCRIHHSYIVNLEKIVHILKTEKPFCMMQNGDKVPISVRKYKELLADLNFAN